MKVAAILCLFLLTLVSAPVWGRSVKTKDATELNRSETKDSREKEESNGEISDAQKDAEANKCTCEIPEDDNQRKSKCEEKCDCSKQDTKKCRIDTKSCNCEPGSKKKNIQCQKEKDGLKGVDTNTNATKKCNCQCSERSRTGKAAFAQMSDDPSVLAVAPLSPQTNIGQGMRKGRGSKKCCCCDCCHDCCCHCCEPCCCCCHCCEPCCCCCCHECCCPCCCHCCHCCPCCCHCCCKKSKPSDQMPQAINPLIAGAHAKPQHH
ncbi:hypothetical protein ABFA07_010807 [Porites harrisoni]